MTADSAAPPIVDNQVELAVQKLKSQFEGLLWLARRFSTPEVTVQATCDAFEALSPRERYAFFLSPAVFSELFREGTSGEAPRLRGLLALLKPDDTSGQEAWDPLFSQARNYQGEPGKHYEAPRLGDSIVVDLVSPFCRRTDLTSPVFFGDYQPLTEEQRSVVLDKLRAALAEIDATAPTLARIIRNYTRVLVVRQREGMLPASEQVSDEVGAIRLLNVHTPHYTHEQLMDDLIHESVHNFLSTYEFLEHPFLLAGGSTDPDARPVSPWSMRPIRVLPFLHAAFVYFAILHYALRRLEKGTLTDEARAQALRQRNRYASGFLMPGALSAYVKPYADIDPRVLHAMDQMQALVRRRFSRTVAPRSEVRPLTQSVTHKEGIP
ncbi:hypothetical protein LZ199_02120 [Myxococcus sp. QH3KD-4-1]|nr:hypothetical protein [Myxococcus qinghaiensis]